MSFSLTPKQNDVVSDAGLVEPRMDHFWPFAQVDNNNIIIIKISSIIKNKSFYLNFSLFYYCYYNYLIK